MEENFHLRFFTLGENKTFREERFFSPRSHSCLLVKPPTPSPTFGPKTKIMIQVLFRVIPSPEFMKAGRHLHTQASVWKDSRVWRRNYKSLRPTWWVGDGTSCLAWDWGGVWDMLQTRRVPGKSGWVGHPSSLPTDADIYSPSLSILTWKPSTVGHLQHSHLVNSIAGTLGCNYLSTFCPVGSHWMREWICRQLPTVIQIRVSPPRI